MSAGRFIATVAAIACVYVIAAYVLCVLTGAVEDRYGLWWGIATAAVSICVLAAIALAASRKVDP